MKKNNGVLERETVKEPNTLFSTLKESIMVITDDKGAEGYQDVFLNISNTNDPPNVVVLSSHYNRASPSKTQMARAETKASIIKKAFFIMLIFMILAILANNASAVTMSDQSINHNAVIYTDADLTCYLTLNETGAVNITWYKDNLDTINRTQPNINCDANTECSTSSSGNVPFTSTVKGDVWICLVTFGNGTDLENRTINITIMDSPPTAPRFYWENDSYISNTSVAQIFEMNPPIYNATIFKVNSSDADGDPITMSLVGSSYYCQLTDYGNASGILTCQPTSESDNGLTRSLATWAYADQYGVRSYIQINVTPTNDPPAIIYSLCNATVNEEQPLSCIIYGTDEESNWPLNFTIASDMGDRLVINESNSTAMRLVFNNSGQNKAVYNDRGNHTVNITVVDNNSEPRTTNGYFVLQIIPKENHAPNISILVINSTSLIQFGNLVIYLNATDVDNDTLIFRTNNTALYNVTNYTSTEYDNTTGLFFSEAWINITNLTNDHVINRYIKIFTSDSKINTSQDVFLNITDVNDPPQIFETSGNSTNTLNNINLSDLTAYTGVLLTYAVNYTDIDFLTYRGDTILFSTNDSRFNIGSSTGVLSFTPDETGDFNFIIFATDQNGSGITVNRTATMHVSLNRNPYFTQVPTISCSEYDSSNNPYPCYYNISANASDEDIPFGDYIALFSINATFFQINQTTGIINFTPNQSQIGNYSLTINITDSRGGFNSTTIYLIINNTNNPPQIDQIIMPGSPYVVGNSYEFTVLADDLDLYLDNSYENLTFNQSITGPNSTLFSIEKVTDDQARITFNPLATTDAGNYTINVSITDTYNNVTSSVINIFIFNMTGTPSIINITPFGTPFMTDSINTSWKLASLFTTSSTNITIYENSTYLFNQNSTVGVSNGYPNNLSYAWYFDDVLKSNENSLNADRINYFNFFSSGMHNITLVVRDYYGSNTSFKWLINVINVNRDPLLLTSLRNITINNYSKQDCSYLQETSALGVHFIDPDDDPSGNNKIDGAEISHLQYTVAPNCSVATITIGVPDCGNANTSVLFTPIDIGSCIVNFTATDSGGLNEISNAVTINVTSVSNSTTEVEVQRSSGGGGSSRSTSIVIPIKKEEEKPRAIEIVVPSLVTIYENHTVLIPVTIKNTWNSSLKEVKLNASSNASSVKLKFTDDYFEELKVGESKEVTLMIDNYRLGNNYEVKITANVTTPLASDSALILLNTIEQAETGIDVETKVTFAQDLLRENPECIELNELLERAKTELSTGSKQEASRMVDAVINGCKYMVSISKKADQQPQSIMNKFFKKENLKYLLIFAGMAAVALVTVFVVRKRRASIIKGENKEEASENEKKEDVKPYWPGSTG